MRNALRPLDLVNLTESFELRRQATVHAKNLVFDEGARRHYIEQIYEAPPERQVVSPSALVVKPIYSRYIFALVIPSQQEYVLRILYLEGKQKTHGLNTLLATVDVVSEEKVICVGHLARIFYEPE